MRHLLMGNSQAFFDLACAAEREFVASSHADNPKDARARDVTLLWDSCNAQFN